VAALSGRAIGGGEWVKRRRQVTSGDGSGYSGQATAMNVGRAVAAMVAGKWQWWQ